MSGSCFCQHMKQRGIVGKCRHIQGNQTLLAHSVHPFLFISLPVLLFLLSSLQQASSSSTAGTVFGQKALHSQRVLVLHRLPQALVLMWGRRKGAQSQTGSKMEGRELQSKKQWMRHINQSSPGGFVHAGASRDRESLGSSVTME